MMDNKINFNKLLHRNERKQQKLLFSAVVVSQHEATATAAWTLSSNTRKIIFFVYKKA
jgi:hypothetical protein